MSERSSSRGRGGQPGNLNALKHGFYSRRFRRREAADLDSDESKGLESEINMMLVMTRRLFDLAGGTRDPDQLASMRVASLLKVQQLVAGSKSDEYSRTIEEAIDTAAKRLGVEL